MKFGNFDSVRLFLHSLGAIEKKKRELDSDFHKVLEIWNKVLPSQNPPPTSQKTQQLKKKFILIGKSKTRYQLVYFLLNTLHKIVSAGSYYCHCDEEKCKICTIPVIFIDFEIDVEKNIFD